MTLSTFYRSKEWNSLREQLIIERTNGDGYVICECCGKPITRRYDCIGHHRKELTEENVNDYTVSLNPENIMLVHFKCHNELHKRWNGFRQEVFLVYGAPCAGKTTWVLSNAFDDDLILDIDRLWESVCKCDRLHKPARLKANVFGIRDTIIDQIRTRTGKWRNAYVIGTYPLQTERNRICVLLQARPVFIEATLEECLSRAPSKDWEQYVLNWFEDYVPPDAVKK